MKVLLTLFMGFVIIQAQKIDIYSRPFQADPDFNIDVLHYDINLKIYDHKKSFTATTSVEFQVLKPYLDEIELKAETFRVTSVFDGNEQLDFTQKNGSIWIKPIEQPRIGDELKYTINYQSDGNTADPSKYGMGGVKVLGLGFFDETDDNPALVQTHSFPECRYYYYQSNYVFPFQ